MREWQSLSHARWYCRLCFTVHNQKAFARARSLDGGLRGGGRAQTACWTKPLEAYG